MALSGGHTPRLLFDVLTQERFRDLPWAKTELFWVDERYVPLDHADSNYRLAREALLDHVPIPKESIHPMPTAAGAPAVDAAAYEALLRQAFLRQAFPGQDWPRLDLVLLGLGEDGHTASLFPGAAALLERRRWVCASQSPKGIRDRITLTLPVLNAARQKLFLVCGKSKAAVLKRALESSEEPPLPAGLIKEAVFLVDREAGGSSGPA
jgi:6-phosphogluconolactonase